MPIVLEATYTKKIGLPAYSSHQYGLTLRTELTDLRQVEEESARLYALLQGCVDRELQATGFQPGGNGNGHGSLPPPPEANGRHAPVANAGNNAGEPNDPPDAWACSDKQQALILKIVGEHRLEKREIEALAQDRFGKGVRQLNKMQASGLIDELLEAHGDGRGRGGRSHAGRAPRGRAA